MNKDWDYCLAAILLEEGGNDDDPHDPGGRTSRGIIQKEYNAYRKRNKLAAQDVWKASNAEVSDIYSRQYWLPYSPDMPSGVNLMYFNMCVNAGPVQANKLLQRCLDVGDDGHIGLITLGAIDALDDNAVVPFIHAYAARCMSFYRSLKGFKYFGKGWTSRTKTIEAKAIKLTTLHLGQTPVSHILDDSQSP